MSEFRKQVFEMSLKHFQSSTVAFLREAGAALVPMVIGIASVFLRQGNSAKPIS